MQAVIKSGKVLAVHPDTQDIAALYDGCEIVPLPAGLEARLEGPDPRLGATEAQLVECNKLLARDQLSKYGKIGVLTGLEEKRAKKRRAVKADMRAVLSDAIGDLQDNLMDVLRAVVLARGIANGAVTDPTVIERFDSSCAKLLKAFGGEKDASKAVAESAKQIKRFAIDSWTPVLASLNAAQTEAAIDAVTYVPVPVEEVPNA